MKIISNIKNANEIGNQLIQKPNKSDDEELIVKSFINTRLFLIVANILALIGVIFWISILQQNQKDYEMTLQGAIAGDQITYMIDGKLHKTPLNEVAIINGEFEEYKSVNVYFNNNKVVEISQADEQYLIIKDIFDVLKFYCIIVVVIFSTGLKTFGKPLSKYIKNM